jgi:hypothetical protein
VFFFAFLHAEKIAPNDIHQRLLKVYGDRTVDVIKAMQWLGRFSSGDSDGKDKPRSGRPCTAPTPRNEDSIDQRIRTYVWIAARGSGTELNIGFNVLETVVATLAYRKVCARLVPPPLVQILTAAACRLLFIASKSKRQRW